jgi:hypothetical protein
MDSLNRFAPFAALFALFVVLQAALIGLDCQQGPAAVAKAFAEDYYYLDEDMQKWLCTSEGDNDETVQAFLNGKRDEAAQRGFDITFLRHMFTHIHVKTVAQSDDTASVHVVGTTRVAINPPFMVVGKLFRIGHDYPVDVTIDLVKEEGRWRVCGQAFGLQS